jgi:hypothetical protein
VDNKTRGTTLCLDLVHAAALNRGRVLPWLLDFKEECPALLDAQEVGHASKLVRAAVNLHDPPAALFG